MALNLLRDIYPDEVAILEDQAEAGGYPAQCEAFAEAIRNYIMQVGPELWLLHPLDLTVAIDDARGGYRTLPLSTLSDEVGLDIGPLRSVRALLEG